MLVVDQLRKGDRNLQVLAGIILAGLLLLLGGLAYVQILSRQRYQESQRHQTFRTVRLPAMRGHILDRHRQPLAENRPVFTIHAYLEELRLEFRKQYIRLKQDWRDSHADQGPNSRKIKILEEQARYQVVSNICYQISAGLGNPKTLKFETLANHYRLRRSLPFPLLNDLTEQEVARYMESVPRMPGIGLETEILRVYPQGTTAAHILGQLGRVRKLDESEQNRSYTYVLPYYEGRTGLEKTFDTGLRGTPGVKAILIDNYRYRHAEEISLEPKPGNHLVLTIDLELQKTVERALRQKGPAGPKTRGAAVVIDTRNGDLLALASSPSFDPNLFIPGISHPEYDQLLDAYLLPLVNRATAGAYMPGSTFKIVVALAGLQAGIIDPEVEVHNPGYYQISGAGRGGRFKDTAAVGDYDLTRALKRSSNTYFIHYGLMMGPELIVAMGQRLALGQRTGIPTYQEQSGLLSQPSEYKSAWYAGHTANISIGQGQVLATPLQLAVMTAAVANGGYVFKPRLVASWDSPQPRVKPKEFHPAKVISKLGVAAQHLDLVMKAMRADVGDSDGTGGKAEVAGMGICGKTGTAQVKENGRVKSLITWFVSFCSLNDPRYAVVVMVEDGLSGGQTCAPIARDIYLGLQKMESNSKTHDLAIHAQRP